MEEKFFAAGARASQTRDGTIRLFALYYSETRRTCARPEPAHFHSEPKDSPSTETAENRPEPAGAEAFPNPPRFGEQPGHHSANSGEDFLFSQPSDASSTFYAEPDYFQYFDLPNAPPTAEDPFEAFAERFAGYCSGNFDWNESSFFNDRAFDAAFDRAFDAAFDEFLNDVPNFFADSTDNSYYSNQNFEPQPNIPQNFGNNYGQQGGFSNFSAPQMNTNMGPPKFNENSQAISISSEESSDEEDEMDTIFIISDSEEEKDDLNKGNKEDEPKKTDTAEKSGHNMILWVESNKENIDGNISGEKNPGVPTEGAVGDAAYGYENSDQIPLPELLEIHGKQLVSGFEFGEATKRRAQQNMQSARNKAQGREEQSTSESTNDSKPSLSQVHKTPHSRKRQRMASARTMRSSERDFSKASRQVPECLRGHPDCVEVWDFMIYKEEALLKLRNPRLFNDFKSVTPRMRAILLDWLMEVAAVYHLRRVTYYLSVDYFDRFLSIRPDIPKSLLQLVGITCLYIAAKVEEIYPPNLNEFSYVCDGACQSKDMISCEVLILNSLGWEVVLTTPTDWLNLYMQLHHKSTDFIRTKLNMDFNKDFVFPQYSAYQFTRASQLIDLLSLDPGFLKFGYSVIAAAAMYYMYGRDTAVAVSGFDWSQLESCVNYMEVFYIIIKDAPDPRLYSCLGGPHPEEMTRFSAGLLRRVQSGPQSENYAFQTHIASMEYFETATIYRLNKLRPKSDSPTTDPEDSASVPADDNNQIVDLREELASLAELTNGAAPVDHNLMTLDEIFELILGQDGNRDST
ncbi:uncharacterized protein LOC123006157 isoform X2 [Tribolium madens]|uniref:uncharacterized protein LOC123006157 isoform X2 n=1 Tax=Tribolium madens TaxID=41895 RepID=UPI001CF75765|nr:uncharacterized protein LOC123006157 isoform X2 [Tribolium madens]